MRQFILTTRDGRALGVVLDDRPMTAEQEARWLARGGARRMRDVAAIAVLERAVSTVEVVHRPRFRRHRRRYAELTYCRPVEIA